MKIKDPNAEAIVKAHDVDGYAADEIATAFGLELEVVKVTLGRYSKVYRDAVSRANLEIVSDEEFALLKSTYKNLVLDETYLTPGSRAKHLQWLLNERKGRNDKIVLPPSTNVAQLNIIMEQTKSKRKAKLDALRSGIVDVPSDAQPA